MCFQLFMHFWQFFIYYSFYTADARKELTIQEDNNKHLKIFRIKYEEMKIWPNKSF